MAFLILCVEKYVIAKHPETDWSVLSEWMWKATSEPWDEWDDRFMEIIPEFLFEFDSYDEAEFDNLTAEEYKTFTTLFSSRDKDLNALLLKLHELQQVYCYEAIPENGVAAINIVLEACKILEQNNIPLPEISSIAFSSFSEKNGWGEDFDGTNLSLILSK